MRPVTMRDVAHSAKVSIRTVSRVVNNQGEITEATRARVSAAIDELGFRPSRLARALATQHSQTIGLIIGDIANPFFSEVASGVQERARASDHDVFFCNSSYSWREELRVLDCLAGQPVEGIIISPSIGLAEAITPFADRYRPIVTIVHGIDHPHISSVLIATHSGAFQAVEHLLNAGHHAVAMLAGPAAVPLTHRRVQGYRDALLARGLEYRPALVCAGDPTFERGRAATLDLLQREPQVTAIFAYNDLLALGAIRACREAGRHVPEDCAVIGFDDIPLANWVSPALSTVRVDKRALGAEAVTRLLDMLDQPDRSFPPFLVPAELVLRETA